jgi:hypothetical protein
MRVHCGAATPKSTASLKGLLNAWALPSKFATSAGCSHTGRNNVPDNERMETAAITRLVLGSRLPPPEPVGGCGVCVGAASPWASW